MTSHKEILNKNFIEKYKLRYDDEYTGKEKKLENKIRNKVSEQFSQKSFYLTKNILEDIVYWKAHRIIGHTKKENEDYIKRITKISFSTDDERSKIEILGLLKGVNFRVASAILHFCFPNKHIVMDRRAWNSLQHFGLIKSEYKDNFDSWWEYLSVCRELSKKFGVCLRDIDKALWFYNGAKRENRELLL